MSHFNGAMLLQLGYWSHVTGATLLELHYWSHITGAMLLEPRKRRVLQPPQMSRTAWHSWKRSLSQSLPVFASISQHFPGCGLDKSCGQSSLTGGTPLHSTAHGALQCTVYTVHCTLYIVHCTLYIVYTVHCIKCTAFSRVASSCLQSGSIPVDC